METAENRLKQFKEPQTAGFHWIVIICIVFCQLLAYTWVRTESTQTILHISKDQKMLARKLSYQKELNIERDRLKSDDRVTRIPRTRLNLLTQTLNQTIFFPESTKIELKTMEKTENAR